MRQLREEFAKEDAEDEAALMGASVEQDLLLEAV